MATPPEPGRDPRGRFTIGNPGGPGGRRTRTTILREAAQQAVSPEQVAALMRRGLRMALEGDVTAMRFVMERVIGKPAQQIVEPEPLDLQLPELDTATDCDRATSAVLAAICQGHIDSKTASMLLSAVQTKLRAIETCEFERRLQQIEEATKLIDGREPLGDPDFSYE